MFSYKEYVNGLLTESEGIATQDTLKQILCNVCELSDDEIDAFGFYLHSNFFDSNEEEYEYYYLTDVLLMLGELDSDLYPAILGELSFDPDDETLPSQETDDEINSKIAPEPEDVGTGDITEAVTAVMRTRNYNHNRRKFMQNSIAFMRRTATIRKRENRIEGPKRRREYRMNKNRKLKYNKSRLHAIQTGKHFVKKRRKA